MPVSLVSPPIAREAPDAISSNTTYSTTTSITTPAKPSSLSSSNTIRPKLSTTLPPLIFGTATLNYQFNIDPYALHPNTLVSAALTSGIRAFDTSPYYGPAEEILGTALHSHEVLNHPSLSNLRREDYHILTKAGRIAGDTFDYSPAWIRHSVARSLRRLKTRYLDVVYLHDVEFVSPDEVLSAIKTLREIRDESSTIRYVGICGYPVHVLTRLAEMILRETGESLDIVQSYANYTVQNQRLESEGLTRFVAAGVDVVANASPLGMGLLRGQGVPVGAMGNWHPAEDELRRRCLQGAEYVEREHGVRLETVAVRFAMEGWLRVGAEVGSRGILPSEVVLRSSVTVNDQDEIANVNDTNNTHSSRPRLGVNVMGVSKLSELEDTMRVYNSIVSSSSSPLSDIPHRTAADLDLDSLTTTIRETILGPEWTDHAWASPDVGFVNQRKQFGVSEAESADEQKLSRLEDGNTTEVTNDASRSTLVEAVKHLDGLERSISVVDWEGDGKAREVEVGVEETGRELTPPS